MPTPLPKEKADALSELIFSGQKIAAVKLYREVTGVGLREAKTEVEAIEASLRKVSPAKFSPPPKAGGCGGAAVVLGLISCFPGYWIFIF